MSTEQKFSINGPIAKLALERGQEPVRRVAGKKPKALDMAAVQKLVDKGAYTWCLFAPSYGYRADNLERWTIGASSDDYVEFMAPSREALSELRARAQAERNPANPPKSLVKKLIAAIKAGRIEEVKTLAPLAARGSFEEQSPLHCAARLDKPAAVTALLPHRDPNALEESSGSTALMKAVSSARCASILLPVSDIKARGSSGQTALMAASQSQGVDRDIFQAVLEGSDPNAVDARGKTALMLAVERGCLQNAEALLPLSDALAKDNEGRDALAVALSEDYWIKQDARGYDKLLTLLVDCCDLSWRSENGEDIPSLLAKRGMSAAVQRLAESGRMRADIPGSDTPLIAATRAGRADIVASLIPHSDLNAKGAKGDTALIIAAQNCDPGLTRLLLRGSDPNAQNDAGRTALMEALGRMPDGGYRHESGLKAIRCALQLIPKTDLNLQDAEGRTALMLAIKPSSMELFEMMLERADANVQDEEGRTSLMLAVSYRGELRDFAELLVPRSDLSLRDAKGRTALMVHVRDPDMVKLLLPGSDVNARDADGRTALIHAAPFAAASAPQASISLLLATADARLVDKDGKSAAMIAREKGAEEMAVLIETAALAQEVPSPARTAAEAAADRRRRRERDL